MELVCVLDEAEQAGHLPETIVEEFTEHPFSMPALWACRDHFYRLDAAARRSHPALPSVFALLAAMAGDLDLAREYVSLLGTTPRHWRMQDLREKDYYRICTELVMPYISDGMFLRIVFFLVKTGMVPVRSLTLSACRPSIINGFRDFTRFGPYLERHKDAITQMIHQLYGSVGKNVYEIMLAEWYYQNNDCFNALILATGTIPLIERESDMRCLFVALALQMRILLMNGQARTAKPLGEKIRDRIQETGREELTASLNALECLAACYDGQQEAVAQWLENTAPDENRDIYMMDMFAWLTKVRCYLQVGKNMAAYVLVRQLITLLEPGKRHMDLCECHMLLAAVYYKSGDKDRMCRELETALALAKKYRYIRLLADEGACMMQMLFIYQREWGADDFTDRIMELAGGVSRYFPNYLKSPAEYYETLTETEKKVLRLMALGMSNDEIAERMGRKAGTVKFHSNSIFRKLRVSNRHQRAPVYRHLQRQRPHDPCVAAWLGTGPVRLCRRGREADGYRRAEAPERELFHQRQRSPGAQQRRHHHPLPVQRRYNGQGQPGRSGLYQQRHHRGLLRVRGQAEPRQPHRDVLQRLGRRHRL